MQQHCKYLYFYTVVILQEKYTPRLFDTENIRGGSAGCEQLVGVENWMCGSKCSAWQVRDGANGGWGVGGVGTARCRLTAYVRHCVSLLA